MGFWTNAQERMRLTNNGNLTINSTNVLGVGILSFPFYGQTQNGLVIKSTWNGNNASYVVIRNHADTTIGSITATTSATSYNTSSDYRLKENVVDIADGITRVKQLCLSVSTLLLTLIQQSMVFSLTKHKPLYQSSSLERTTKLMMMATL